MSAAEYLPIVSVIIPTLNEESYIGDCIASVLNCDYPKEKLEIIVCDNGSTDNTIQIAQSLGAKVIIDRSKKIGGLRNLGYKLSSGEVLGFLDADCTVTKDWIKNAIAILRKDHVGVTGAPCMPPETGSWIEKTWGFYVQTQHGSNGEARYINSGNCFIRKDVFRLVGGFSETLESSEDTDICFRIREKGYKILQNKAVAAVHWGYPKSLRDFIKREIWHGLGSTERYIDCFWTSKPILLAIYNIVILLACLTFIIFFDGTKLAFCAILVPYLINAIIVCVTSQKIEYVLKLTFLFFLYGIARSIALLLFLNRVPLRKIKFSNCYDK